MIDCENEVYTRVKTEVKATFSDIDSSSEYVNAPASFPHMSVEMTDSYPADATNALSEGMTRCVFTVNVYSNKANGRKAEAKKIMNIINEAFASMNFTRLSQMPMPNLADNTIYRIVARFAGKTDGEYFYRT